MQSGKDTEQHALACGRSDTNDSRSRTQWEHNAFLAYMHVACKRQTDTMGTQKDTLFNSLVGI